MMIKHNVNQTKAAAKERVQRARLGSLAGEPSEQYLAALRTELYDWIADVERQLYNEWVKELDNVY